MPRVSHGLLFLSALALLWACGANEDLPSPAAHPQDKAGEASSAAACDLGAPDPAALLPSGYDGAKQSAILPNGQLITPAGKTVQVESPQLCGVVFAPDGKKAYAVSCQDSSFLYVFDLGGETPLLLASLPIKAGHGLALSRDGKTLYVPGGATEQVHLVDVSGETPVITGELLAKGYIEAVALNPDESTLIAVGSGHSAIYNFILGDTGATPVAPAELAIGYMPYEAVFSKDGGTLYVSNMAAGTVAVVEMKGFSKTAVIPVGKNPEGLALVEDGAFLVVANSDSDTLSVINTATNAVTQTIEIETVNPGLRAWTPNAVAAHPDPSKHLAYVASANHNAVEVLDTEKFALIGALPTAWYPVALALDASGDHMAVANAKGFGLPTSKITQSGLLGVFQYLPMPANQAELDTQSRIVKSNTERPLGFYPDSTCKNQVPLPTGENEAPLIEHVILVIKENKTYDEVLGDLPNAPGGFKWHDPELALYGEYTDANNKKIQNTPNAHALATTWVDFVNYYANAEQSIQGHLWTSEVQSNDYTEKNYTNRLVLPGVDPVSMGENRSVFWHLFNHNVSFRVYGEAVNFALNEMELWRDKIDTKYPYWTLGVSDVVKARRVIHEWDMAKAAYERGDMAAYNTLFPRFIYIGLPNDHTQGGKAKAMTPRAFLADNDHAFGLLVDWVTHSPFYEKTIIFIIEDDPQSAVGDHIDAHRSLCYAISPYIKRGYQSTVHYSIPSLYRTIELILGLPPINKNTAYANPMADIFTAAKDITPYTAIKPEVPYETNPENTEAARASAKYDWTVVDGHEGLGDIVYKMLRPGVPRPANAKRIDD